MTDIRAKLIEAGLRPTRQRELIAEHLLEGEDRHFTAEQLYQELLGGEDRVSLATIYNTLGAFTEAGLLSTVSLDSGRLFYDTNTAQHYHLYDQEGLELTDIRPDGIQITGLPEIGEGQEIERVDIIVRTRKA